MADVAFSTVLAEQEPAGACMVVHLGAGTGEDLTAHLAQGAERVLLVEPDPDLQPHLQALAAAHPGAEITVLPVAVGAEPGSAPLAVCNCSALSSLAAPLPELAALFPGLAVLRQEPVPVARLAEILAPLALPPDRSALLVIDTPGAEAEVLAQLLAGEDGLAAGFGRVLLRAPRVPLWQGGQPAQALLAQLDEAGYRLERREEEDPDFPVFATRYDAGLVELRALRAAVAEAGRVQEGLRADLARSEAARAEQESRAATFEGKARDRASRIAALETALAEARSEAETAGAAAQDTSLRVIALEAAQREAGLRAVEQAKTLTSQEAEIAKLKAKLAKALSTQAEDEAARQAEWQAETARLTAARDEAASRAEAVARQLSQRDEQLRGAEAGQTVLRRKLDEALSRLAEQEAARARAEAELAAGDENSAAALAELQREAAARQAWLDRAGQDLAAQVARAEQLETELAARDAALAAGEAELERLRAALHEQAPRLESLEADLAEKDQELKAGRVEMRRQRGLLEDLRAAQRDLEARLAVEERRGRHAETEISRAEAQLLLLRELMMPALAEARG